MQYRHKDNSARAMLQSNIINNPYKKINTWRTLDEYLSDTESKRVDLSKFEIKLNEDGSLAKNILNRFYLSLDDPKYLVKLKFDFTQANEFSEKLKSIAKHIYGDTSFFYIIMYFNNINHPSELSSNFLMKNGLVVLNETGLNKLNEIVQFISSKSASSDYGSEVLGI